MTPQHDEERGVTAVSAELYEKVTRYHAAIGADCPEMGSTAMQRCFSYELRSSPPVMFAIEQASLSQFSKPTR